MKRHETAIIYGLIDPNEVEHIRYVGTTIDIDARFRSHIKRPFVRDSAGRFMEKHTHKNAWVRKLAKEGRVPELLLIEFVPENVRRDKEHEWIILLKADGHKLTNATDGREGPERRIQPLDERERRARKLKEFKNRPEEKARQAELTRVQMQNPVRRKQSSKNAFAQWKDPEHRKNVSEKIRISHNEPSYKQAQSVRRKEWYTKKENAEKVIQYSERFKGEKNPSAKLDEIKVKEIREKYNSFEGRIIYKDLALEYGVTSSLIGQIICNRVWIDEKYKPIVRVWGRIVPEGKRWCYRCQKFLLFENFSRNKSNVTGYSNSCKKCQSKRENKDL